jgi:transposase
MYTYRFEEYVLRMLIGSNEEEVAARLGISAETVELIVENQLKDDKRIDPARVIKHVGMDEISLKKRHKLYVTVMTDLTDAESPKVLAVARGRDTAAALECLGKLAPQQRAAVETHRVDMGKVYGSVCSEQLPHSRLVVDRFHVAKQFNEVVDDLRKKNHAEVQGPVVEGGAEAVPLGDVGVPPRSEGPQARGTRGVGSAVCGDSRVEGRV